MERENQRIAITKRMLKESILEILKKKDLDAINVTELCREAGINRATFYRHYEIPRDVLMEIQRDLYHELRQQMKLPKSREEIRPGLEEMCAFMDEHLDLLRILIRCNSDTDFANFINDIYMEFVKEYVHLEPLRKLSKEDLQLLLLYSAGGSYFVLRSWILGSIKKSPKEMADYIYGLLDRTELLLISSMSEWKRK